VDAFASGLRGRMFKAGGHVLTAKPGFVATANEVAAKIKKAVEKKKEVAYVPGFWRPILFIIRSIPESIFKHQGI
jgi:short-subunit dehydrogenase